MRQPYLPVTICLSLVMASLTRPGMTDHIRDIQTTAVRSKTADWGYWGSDASQYSNWRNHSNRLIPVYTFGLSLDSVRGQASPYRSVAKLKRLYGRVPEGTFNPDADYFDQTDIYRLQQLAVSQGKKRIILFIFDGMDWQTTRLASIVSSGRVAYRQGRGTGLAFQDYRGAETDFGWFVTAPYSAGGKSDATTQKFAAPGTSFGGYDSRIGGQFPWSQPLDAQYPMGTSRDRKHPYTDSAASATAMTAGIKTINGAINVDPSGRPVEPIARQLQRAGFSVGVVTAVPISHATPASAYANNVTRADYQDLTRDLLGLPSVTHPVPLPGVDVLLGSGFGEIETADSSQGNNFVPGNRYLTAADLKQLRLKQNTCRVVLRTKSSSGRGILQQAVRNATQSRERLFGFFGVRGGHLPFQTADGKFDPTVGTPADSTEAETAAEVYSAADIAENPRLADMTLAALHVLSARSDRFWLMVEAGDVDWANHKNNIDDSVGAVLSGTAAFTAACRWIESHDGWDETALILTADHGHTLNLTRPEKLIIHRP
ncbi:MAG: alkaline phosphatase [Planctomycetaceae bacterium]